MKKIMNENDKIYYSNFKVKIDSNNIYDNVRNNINDKNNNNSKNGTVISIMSFLLFCLIFIPYLIKCFWDESLIVIGGILIFPVIIISFIFGYIAHYRYKSSECNNKKIRKFFNICNLISLFIMGIYILILLPIASIFTFPFIVIILIVIYICLKNNFI